MNVILQTHLIDPALLRSDDFEEFYVARRTALVSAIEQAMGKQVMVGGAPEAEDLEGDEDA